MFTRERKAMAPAKVGHEREWASGTQDFATARSWTPAIHAAGARTTEGWAGSVLWTALVVDAVMIGAAVVTAELLTGAGSDPFFWFVAFGGLALVFLYKRGLYDWRVRVQVLDDLRGVVTVTLLAITSILSLRVVLGGTNDVAAQSLHVWAFAAVYLAAGRIALESLWLQDRREGDNAKSTLIIGAGKIGHLVANRLLEHPEFGLRPIGFLDKEPLDHAESPLPILGASWDLEQVIEEHGVDHVVVAFSTAPSDVLLRQMQRCEEAGVGISVVPRLYEYMTDRVTIEHIGGLPLVSPRRIRTQSWQFTVKYAVDGAVAATLLVLLSPRSRSLPSGSSSQSVGRFCSGRPESASVGQFGLGVQDDDAHVDGSTAAHGRADDEYCARGIEGADRRSAPQHHPSFVAGRAAAAHQRGPAKMGRSDWPSGRSSRSSGGRSPPTRPHRASRHHRLADPWPGEDLLTDRRVDNYYSRTGRFG
jgi:hypothetical protein